MITVDRRTHWVPDGWGTFEISDPETHYTHEDYHYEIEFRAVAALPPTGPAIEIEKTARVADESYPEEAAPVPRTPRSESRPPSDRAWLGTPPWPDPQTA